MSLSKTLIKKGDFSIKFYFFRKIILSFEFIIIVFFFCFRSSNETIAKLNSYFVGNSLAFLGSSLTAFLYLIWKTTFIDMDQEGLIKDFPQKKEIYLLRVIESSYFVFFGHLVFLGGIEINNNDLYLPELYPLMGGIGMSSLLSSMAINLFVINVIFRDHQKK